MDPVSQAVVGAAFTQSLARNNLSQKLACVVGALAGMAADVDVLFHSSTDPLLFLEFHRQFTHSLVFIPVGGLLTAAILYFLLRRKTQFRTLWIYATLGYGTHGLLDACTSYGTQLFWPFSDTRIAWNIIAIIDPLFTVPVLTLIVLGVIRKSALFPKLAIVWMAIYFGVGVLQHERAEAVLVDLASDRGHSIERKTVKPTFGNLILWKLLYQHDGRYYVDAAHLSDETNVYPGESTQVLELAKTELVSTVQASDIERFRWFSDGYIARSASDPQKIGDIRYSMLPNSIDPLWSIQLLPQQPDAHVDYIVSRDLAADKREAFLSMLFRSSSKTIFDKEQAGKPNKQ